MENQTRRGWGAWCVPAITFVCFVGALVHQLVTPIDAAMGWGFRGFILVVGAPYVVVGTAIDFRSPDKRVGRLLMGMGALFVFAGVASEYALRGLVYRPGSLPGAIYVAWFLQWAWILMFGLVMFVFLLFPNGEFASYRWRRFSLLAGFSIPFAAAAFGATPGPLDSFTARPVFSNPLGWSVLTVETASLAILPWLSCLAASAVSLFLRFRKATGIERLQLKWLALGALFTAVAFFSAGAFQTNETVGEVLTTIGIFLLPISIGISILRYRLYDIDVLINRAIVYVLLTGALAGTYVVLVLGFQRLMEPFTVDSDLAIAASTLGVAALFRPARSRLQDFIDRRFYRRKFDAEQTVMAFTGRLRNEVDLRVVTSDLVRVVHDTVQPSHVSMWMRPPPD